MAAPVIGYSELALYLVVALGSPGLGYAVLRLSDSGIRAWPKEYKHGWAWITSLGFIAFSAVVTYFLESFLGRAAEAYFAPVFMATALGFTVSYRLKAHYSPARTAEISLPKNYLQTRAAVKEGRPEKVPREVMVREILPPPPTLETVMRAENETKVEGILDILRQTLNPEGEELGVPEVVSLEEQARREEREKERIAREAARSPPALEGAVHRRERRQMESLEKEQAEPEKPEEPQGTKVHARWREHRPAPPPPPQPAPYSVLDAVKHSSHSDEKKAEVEGKVMGIISQLSEEQKPSGSRRRERVREQFAAPVVPEGFEGGHRRRYLMTAKRKWSEEGSREAPLGPMTPPLEQKPVQDVAALMKAMEGITGQKQALSMEDVHKSLPDEQIPAMEEIESLATQTSKTQTIKNPDKKCPRCHAASTRYILCSQCGQTFCTNCAASVDHGDTTLDYKCPNCSQLNKVVKKKAEEILEEITEF